MRWKRETWNPNNVLRGCRKKKRREAQRERTEAWLRESPRHETTLFCFDRSSQPRPRREEEEKKRKWNEEGEKERNKARVKWSKKLTHKVEMQCGDKEKDGRLRKKEKMGVCGCVRKKKRLAIQHNTTQHNNRSSLPPEEEEEEEMFKQNNHANANNLFYFNTLPQTLIIHISRFLFYSFHFTFIRTVRYPNSLSVYSCLSFSLNNSPSPLFLSFSRLPPFLFSSFSHFLSYFWIFSNKHYSMCVAYQSQLISTLLIILSHYI